LTGRIRAAVAVLGLVACVVPGLADAGSRLAHPPVLIPIKGAVTLKPFDVTKNCGGVTTTKTIFQIHCAQLGAYKGAPAAGGASYSWQWNLARDARGFTTGVATERGKLILDFGATGALYLSLVGKQVPVGTTTSIHAQGVSKGKWTIAKGTATFLGRQGGGTYRFTTVRNGSKTVFSVGQVALSGLVK
jgi:hypothetical protein